MLLKSVFSVEWSPKQLGHAATERPLGGIPGTAIPGAFQVFHHQNGTRRGCQPRRYRVFVGAALRRPPAQSARRAARSIT